MFSSACLLYGEVSTSLIVWFLHFSVISMSPLLLKDGLLLQQLAASILFLVVISELDKNNIKSKLEKQLSIPVSLDGKTYFFCLFLLSCVLLLLRCPTALTATVNARILHRRDRILTAI